MYFRIIDLIVSLLETTAFIFFINKCLFKNYEKIKVILSIIIISLVVHFSTVSLSPDISMVVSAVAIVAVSVFLFKTKLLNIILGYFIIVTIISIADMIGFYLAKNIYNYCTLIQVRGHINSFLILVAPEAPFLLCFIIASKFFAIQFRNIISNRRAIFCSLLLFSYFVFVIMPITSILGKLAVTVIYTLLLIILIVYFFVKFTPESERELYLNLSQNLRHYVQHQHEEEFQTLPIVNTYLQMGKVEKAQQMLEKYLDGRKSVDWDSIMGDENGVYMAGFSKLFFNKIEFIIDERISLDDLVADIFDLTNLFREITKNVFRYNVNSVKISTLDYLDEILVVIKLSTQSATENLDLTNINNIVKDLNGSLQQKVELNCIKLKIKLPKKSELI